MTWRKVKLGALYEVHNGLSKSRDSFGEGFPFLSYSTVFNNFFLPPTLDSLVRTNQKEQDSYSIREGDVFITRTSETSEELGMSCVALKDYPHATYNGFCKRLRPITDEVYPRYIGYYLRTSEFRSRFDGLGAAMITRASLRNEDLLSMTVALPPMPVQRKIAAVLGAYDDLIENNRRRIALLEKIARELYRERFMRRAGERGQTSINDVCAIQYGYAFNAKMFNASGNGFPIVRIRNIQSGISSDYTTEHASSAYVVRNGEVLVGMDGEFHINLWSGGDAYLVQRCCCFRPYDESLKGYLMEAIRLPIKYFEKSAMGATVGHLGKKDIDTIRVALPTSAEKELFRSVFDERLSLSLQNRNLARQRDRLLPRLMSGKINLEKLV